MPSSARGLPFGALLALVALGGCADMVTDAYDYGTVEVRVETRAGAPFPGIDLLLFTGDRHMATGTTGEDGRHVFDLVPFGNYGVRLFPPPGHVVTDGGATVLDAIQIEEGERRTVEFTLEPCEGAIRVAVVDQAGAPVPDALLVLYTSQGVVEQVRTGADGTHVFTAVLCGQYGVSVDPPAGYTVEPGRGSSFFDGLQLGVGDIFDIEFTVTEVATGG